MKRLFFCLTIFIGLTANSQNVNEIRSTLLNHGLNYFQIIDSIDQLVENDTNLTLPGTVDVIKLVIY